MEKLSTSPPPPLVAKLERKSSLEEPLTLSHEEVNSLRETAIHVINTYTREEAEKIFLAGLEPVTVTPKVSSAPKVHGE